MHCWNEINYNDQILPCQGHLTLTLGRTESQWLHGASVNSTEYRQKADWDNDIRWSELTVYRPESYTVIVMSADDYGRLYVNLDGIQKELVSGRHTVWTRLTCLSRQGKKDMFHPYLELIGWWDFPLMEAGRYPYGIKLPVFGLIGLLLNF